MNTTVIEQAKKNAICITTQMTGSIDQIDANFKINSDNDYIKIIETLGEVKKTYKELDTKRKLIVRPINEAKNGIQELFKPNLDRLKQIETDMKEQIVVWQKKQEKIRQIEQRKQIEEAKKKEEEQRKLIEKQIEKAEFCGDDEAIEELIIEKSTVFEPAKIIEKQKVEGISQRKTYVPEIVDIHAIPREYLIPDMDMLKKIGKATKGCIEIPGVKFIEKTIIINR